MLTRNFKFKLTRNFKFKLTCTLTIFVDYGIFNIIFLEPEWAIEGVRNIIVLVKSN